MLVHKKIGSSNRLKEMFERINKVKLNEDFFKPEDEEEEEAVTPEDITGDITDEEGEGVEHGEEPPSDNPSIEPDYAADPERQTDPNGSDVQAMMASKEEMGDISPEAAMDDMPPEESGIEPEMEASCDTLEGGIGDDAEPSQFNPEQVAIGVRTEMEHTKDPKIALEITLDHLTEIPDYYTRLDTMETQATMDAPQNQDGGSEEEAIIFGKNDNWVDSYKPVSVGETPAQEEGANFPHPEQDPEAGEEEFEFAEKAKRGELEDKKENPKDPSELIKNPNIDDFSKLAGY